LDHPQGGTIFLYDAEPARTIRRVRRLENAGVEFPLNDFANVVVDAGRYGHVPHDPRLVLYRWHLYWREEIFPEVSSLFVVPSESVLVYAHEIMHKITFYRPKEVVVMRLVDVFLTLKGISSSG
jgi:hypothetical protein